MRASMELFRPRTAPKARALRTFLDMSMDTVFFAIVDYFVDPYCKADPERRITMQSQNISLPSKAGSFAEIQNALRPFDMVQAKVTQKGSADDKVRLLMRITMLVILYAQHLESITYISQLSSTLMLSQFVIIDEGSSVHDNTLHVLGACNNHNLATLGSDEWRNKFTCLWAYISLQRDFCPGTFICA